MPDTSTVIAGSIIESVLRHDRVLAVGGMLMPMSTWPGTASHAVLMTVMWVVMMTAMMLPSAAPMVLLYATIARGRREKGERTGSAGIFASGYIVVWAAFSMVLAGAVLIAAGIYQLTPLKQACLRRCRSPLEFMLTQWREGTRGAFLMGCRHGAYCVGCCWLLMLMLLLFVGGVMNLAWIAGLAVFVLMEKLAPAGHWVGWGAGLALIGWGTATLLTAI